MDFHINHFEQNNKELNYHLRLAGKFFRARYGYIVPLLPASDKLIRYSFVFQLDLYL